MISKKLLRFSALVVAASVTPAAFGGLASLTMNILPDTGDAYVDGLPVRKTVNLAGETTTVLATCTGQTRKVIDRRLNQTGQL